MKWPKKFSLHNHYHTQSVIPESIPSQKHILQELSDEQVKALNPSQTAEKRQTLLQSNYTTCLSEILVWIITMKII